MQVNLQDRLCFPEHVDEHGVVLEQQARRLVVIRLRGRVQSSFCKVNSRLCIQFYISIVQL
jgi:hypothetical protein